MERLQTISGIHNLNEIKNWEENKNKEVSVRKIDATHTQTWLEGWYRNSTSGRSLNYGINASNPTKHKTVILKGGSFFSDYNFRTALSDKGLSIPELFGGNSYKDTKKEYDIATLIQKLFKIQLGKTANCPQPLDIKIISGILDRDGNIIKLTDFFSNMITAEKKRNSYFTIDNFIQSAMNLDIDLGYPMSNEANEEVKRDPYRWIVKQYLDKTRESIYKYQIDGPNTRLLDLMTLPLVNRIDYFTKANGAVDIIDALNKFTVKLGEFYGLLHRNLFSYQKGSIEHCPLADITITGIVMDIGGISQNQSDTKNRGSSDRQQMMKALNETLGRLGVENENTTKDAYNAIDHHQNEAYVTQFLIITNLIAYICKHIFVVDDKITKKILEKFRTTYQLICTDINIDNFPHYDPTTRSPKRIRTKYIDYSTGDWIRLAQDLQYVASDHS